jgi:hypothetical protein
MKRTFILSAAAVMAAALVFTSCQPSRVWATKKKDKDRDHSYRDYREPDEYRYKTPPPPPPRRTYASASLIITPTPGFVMRQHPNGGYYHQSPRGFMYWKGYDNRFYLDRDDLRKVSFTRWEYDEWKRYSRQNR